MDSVTLVPFSHHVDGCCTDTLSCPSLQLAGPGAAPHPQRSRAPQQGSEPRLALVSCAAGRAPLQPLSWGAAVFSACSRPDRLDVHRERLMEAGLPGPREMGRDWPGSTVPLFSQIPGMGHKRPGVFEVLGQVGASWSWQVPSRPPALWEASTGLPSPRSLQSPIPSFSELCLGRGFPVGQRLLDVSVQREALPVPGQTAPPSGSELWLSAWPRRRHPGPRVSEPGSVFSRASRLGSVGAGPRARSVPGLGLRFRVSPCGPLPRAVPAPLCFCQARGASGARSPASRSSAVAPGRTWGSLPAGAVGGDAPWATPQQRVTV